VEQPCAKVDVAMVARRWLPMRSLGLWIPTHPSPRSSPLLAATAGH
jgi:hypothetical protein